MNKNQIDMLVDFDNGILSYKIVDDKEKERNYTFKKTFNTNINYTVHLHFLHSQTRVQIAKIDIDMFGKNKTFVNYNLANIKRVINNSLTIETIKNNTNNTYANKPMMHNNISQSHMHIHNEVQHSLCKFDLKSTIDFDNKYIKVDDTYNAYYAMILPDNNVQGYSSGKHCWRRYYKTPNGNNEWLMFGIYI